MKLFKTILAIILTQILIFAAYFIWYYIPWEWLFKNKELVDQIFKWFYYGVFSVFGTYYLRKWLLHN